MIEKEAIAVDETRQALETESSTELVQAMQFLFNWNAELIGFYAHRYQQYGALPLRFLTCSTLSDLETLQGEFLQQLAEDYRDETAKLSKIAGEPDRQSDASLESGYAAGLQKAQQDASTIIEEAKAQAERILASAEMQADPLTEPDQKQKKKVA